MEQDVFLITAKFMQESSNKLADQFYKAYHSLAQPETSYGESMWALYLLHQTIADKIGESIEKYQRGRE